MPGELQYLNLTDFTGGINLSDGQFQLADNESPDMLNVTLDARSGFEARGGLIRLNDADIENPLDWDPRSAETIVLNSGQTASYIASNGTIYTSANGVTWEDMAANCSASPHLADYASWGNKTYIACGPGDQSICQEGNYDQATNSFVSLPNAEPTRFNDDYTVPDANPDCAPQAEVCEPHAGYIFWANTSETVTGVSTSYPNRLRWSHPLVPTAYATNDYIDIETGGGQITALASFQDHLLIFKTDSLWALYGYTSESFQLIQVSERIGVPHPGCITRSESSVFFYSSSDRGDVWGYNGQSPARLSEKLSSVMDDIIEHDDVWVSWAGRTLILSVPWNNDPQDSGGRTVFIWDPSVGQGVWTRNSSAQDEVRCILENGDVLAGGKAVFVMAGGTAGVVKSGGERALDYIRQGDVTGQPYEIRYRTRWMDAGYPERRKSWRRGRFVTPAPTGAVQVSVATFHDYSEATPIRSHYLSLNSDGSSVWSIAGYTDGADGKFDWDADGGDSVAGADYELSSRTGSQILREQPLGPGASGLGVAAAVQLLFKTTKENNTLGSRWGIDAATLKHRSRRGTT